MEIKFNEEKNKLLKEKRWICFDDVLDAINNGDVIDITPNVNYKNQQNIILKINNYIYICPFVREKDWIFLKTLYASRKHNKIYNS
jgi:TATA-binding protein-associated factor Taf7